MRKLHGIGATGRRVLKGLVVEIQPENALDAPVTVICSGEMRLHHGRWTGCLTVTWAYDDALVGTEIPVNLLDYEVTPNRMGKYVLRKMQMLPTEVGRIVATLQPLPAAGATG